MADKASGNREAACSHHWKSTVLNLPRLHLALKLLNLRLCGEGAAIRRLGAIGIVFDEQNLTPSLSIGMNQPQRRTKLVDVPL